MPIMRFSSRALASGDATHDGVQRRYRTVLNRALGVDVEAMAAGPPQIEAQMRVLPGVVIARQDLSTMRMMRTAAHLSDGQDGVVLSIPLRGGARYRGKRLPAVDCKVGSAVVFDAAQEYVIENNGMVRLSIRLSRKLVEARLAHLPEATFRATPALRLLVDYASCLLAQDAEFAPAENSVIATHVTDLAILAMSPDGFAPDASSGGVRAARFQAICARMAARLDDPELGLAQIAAEQGISVQYARALLNARGTTFHDHLRGLRIARAQKLLADPIRGSKISAVAFESGLNDLSYFNRCFRAATGMAPGDWRSLHAAIGDSAPSKR